MPRILHGTKPDEPSPSVAFNMVRPIGQNGPFVPNTAFSNNRPMNVNLNNCSNVHFGPRSSRDAIRGPFGAYNRPAFAPVSPQSNVFQGNQRFSPNISSVRLSNGQSFGQNSGHATHT